MLNTVSSIFACCLCTQLEVKVTWAGELIKVSVLSTNATVNPNEPPALMVLSVIDNCISPSINSPLSLK